MSMELMVKAMKIRVGNPLRKLVLIKLADNASDQGECWPSYQHIADQCEISKRSVMNHIAALCESGLVKKVTRKGEKGNSSNIYLLHPRRTRKRRKPAQNPQKRLPHRPPVRRRHRHHRRLLQKMRRPDKRPQRRAAPRQHPRRRQRQLAVRRRQHRAKVRRNPRQRAPRQRQNGQRILHPPWRLRMQVRRKRG